VGRRGRAPLGEAVERRFTDDTVRGVVATDALIGTFASLHDPSLIQNRCFLYHLVGNGTGEWRVPVGGMGAVTDALRRTAVEAGAEILTGAGVSAVRTSEGADGAEVSWASADGSEHTVAARTVLSNVAPWVLRILRGEPDDPTTKPEGAQLKINVLLDRLPRLRSGVDPAVAFSGTLHLGEDYSQLEAAYADAAAGRVPSSMPGEVYCHSLTDPSILGDVPEGTHTLTYFGLHTPASLFEADPVGTRALAVERAIASLDQHLVEPLATCVARDAAGNPCIEAKIPQDVERDLAMPGGHIFHGDLEWPWAPGRALLDTPRPALGRADDHGRRPALRLRRPTRRRGVRDRRPQRGPGRAGVTVTGATVSRFHRAGLAGNVPSRSTTRASSSMVEQLTLNQRVRGSSPCWRTDTDTAPGPGDQARGLLTFPGTLRRAVTPRRPQPSGAPASPPRSRRPRPA
jgi:phytoene dehydrogenase-like protein